MLQLKLSGTPDLEAALAALDPGKIPSAEEIETVLRKRLTKGLLQLEALGAEETVQDGDVVSISISGAEGKPKYNKPRLKVTVGQGLYSKELEPRMVGHKAGDAYEDAAEGLPVQVQILEIRRKVVPEITDAMAADMHIEGVSTVAEYRAHLTKELTDYVVFPAMAEIVDQMVQQAAPEEPDQAISAQLGELEWSFFGTMFHKEKNINLEQLSPEELFEQLHVRSKEEFLKQRESWYPQKAKMCAALAAALGVSLTGDLDPLVHYDALNSLQMMVADRVRKAMGGK